jgi:hypothetical protein
MKQLKILQKSSLKGFFQTFKEPHGAKIDTQGNHPEIVALAGSHAAKDIALVSNIEKFVAEVGTDVVEATDG